MNQLIRYTIGLNDQTGAMSRWCYFQGKHTGTSKVFQYCSEGGLLTWRQLDIK